MNDDLRRFVKPLSWEPVGYQNKICRGWDNLLRLEFFYWTDRTCGVWQNNQPIDAAGFHVYDVDEAGAKAAAHAYYADKVLAAITPAALAASSKAIEGPLFKTPEQALLAAESDLPERLWVAFDPDEGGYFVEALSLDGGHPGDSEFVRAVLLSNPTAVHLNLLAGKIAKPSLAQIRHLYAAELAAEAGKEGGNA
jgi:hypothetical protein